ncbi:hypothetical protein RF11_02723 [Thelohanellus kitauei]|uniref:Integrase catalytic domain-containing protein n=1 Tax=Thelohanellus kitauei TaxID=669202 RepID=A0A0C2J883_THEKT|nr:hypothetical protein RF11_02723 [Thelohanellus kitauei]
MFVAQVKQTFSSRTQNPAESIREFGIMLARQHHKGFETTSQEHLVCRFISGLQYMPCDKKFRKKVKTELELLNDEMRKGTDLWCKSCVVCGQRNNQNQYTRQKMMENIHLGYTRIFFKIRSLDALKCITAENVAKKFIDGFSLKFGIPTKSLGVLKTHPTPHHPQSDGMVERFNRTLKNSLSKLVQNDNEWAMFLQAISELATVFVFVSVDHEGGKNKSSRLWRGPYTIIDIKTPLVKSTTTINPIGLMVTDAKSRSKIHTTRKHLKENLLLKTFRYIDLNSIDHTDGSNNQPHDIRKPPRYCQGDDTEFPWRGRSVT